MVETKRVGGAQSDERRKQQRGRAEGIANLKDRPKTAFRARHRTAFRARDQGYHRVPPRIRRKSAQVRGGQPALPCRHCATAWAQFG